MKVEEIRLESGERVNDPDPQLPEVPQAITRDFSAYGLDALCALRDDMSDLEESLEDIKSFGGPEARKKACKLIRSVNEFNPSITMIGQIKSGKTSLVNVMSGLPDLLPADVNPWTSVVTSLHLNGAVSDTTPTASFELFDLEEWDHLVKKGGRLGELSNRQGADEEVQKVNEQIARMRQKTKARLGDNFEALLGQTHTYRYLDEALLQRYVCMGDDFGTPDMHDPQGQFADLTKSAALNLSTAAIPIPLTIRDTPGVNDTFMMREQVTINALRTSRICVVVLSATQALNSVDMGLIRLISNVKSREVIIFVNRIDELANPAAAIGEIRASILQTLADNNGPSGLTVLFGSAYWAQMALLDQVDQIDPDSAASLALYAGDLDVEDGGTAPDTVWQMSGIPDLFEAIGTRIAEGEGAELIHAVRRRALNHLQGLRASSSLVSLRLEDHVVDMIETDALLSRLTAIETQLVTQLNDELDVLFGKYEARIDQAHNRFLDRALESLLAHLERHGEDEVWHYSPDGLRVLLRSGYHMMRKKVEKTCDTVFAAGSAALTQTYTQMLSVQVEGFVITPPRAPSFPPPVTLGQTIALDLQGSWWKGWWQRRKGYASYADEFYKLIAAETAPMIEDMKVTQTNDIRRIAMAELHDFLAEQQGILTDVSQKSQVSLEELNGLFGITEQAERDQLFDILFEEFGGEDAVGVDVGADPSTARPAA